MGWGSRTVHACLRFVHPCCPLRIDGSDPPQPQAHHPGGQCDGTSRDRAWLRAIFHSRHLRRASSARRAVAAVDRNHRSTQVSTWSAFVSRSARFTLAVRNPTTARRWNTNPPLAPNHVSEPGAVTLLRYVDSSLFCSSARVLVNTVNTVGVTGDSATAEFATRFPDMYQLYREHCNAGRLHIGHLWLYRTPGRWVLNFPTTACWRSSSEIEYIRAGLQKFVATYQQRGIDSISFPSLGWDSGQLDFDTQVRPLMEQYLCSLPIPVYIHRRHESSRFSAEHDASDSCPPLTHPGSFNELWRQLLQLADRDLDLKTFTTASRFNLIDVTDNHLVFDRIRGSRVHIPAGDVRTLWHHLNNIGTVLPREAPGRIGREYSLVFPLLAQLPYMDRVILSDDYDRFRRGQVQGLQLRFRSAHVTYSPTELE